MDDERVLVDVFTEFLSTNNRGWCSIEAIIDDIPRWHRAAVNQFAVYKHLGIPYLATIFVYQSADVWLNIKLNTDGYVFSPTNAKVRIPRHNDSRWTRMSKRKLDHFEGIRINFREHYSGVKIFTNEFIQKVDMKFFAKDPKNPKTPHVLIGFESGYPCYDEGPEDADAC